MIILIILGILFVLLGIVPQILNLFDIKDIYIYDENGTEKRYGDDIIWPDGAEEPDDTSWKKFPCIKKHKVVFSGYDWEFESAILPWLGTLIFGAGFIIPLICTISIHTSWEVAEVSNEITERIIELESRKDNLLSYYNNSIAKDIDISSTNLPGNISEHNSEVKEFVVKLKNKKIDLDNPWISVFVNPAYKNVDIARVEATYINL